MKRITYFIYNLTLRYLSLQMILSLKPLNINSFLCCRVYFLHYHSKKGHPSEGDSCQLHCKRTAFLRFSHVSPLDPCPFLLLFLDHAHSWRHLSSFSTLPRPKRHDQTLCHPAHSTSDSLPPCLPLPNILPLSWPSLWPILTFLICASLRWPLKCRVTSLVCVCGAICIWVSEYLRIWVLYPCVLCVLCVLCGLYLSWGRAWTRPGPGPGCVLFLIHAPLSALGVFPKLVHLYLMMTLPPPSSNNQTPGSSLLV